MYKLVYTQFIKYLYICTHFCFLCIYTYIKKDVTVAKLFNFFKKDNVRWEIARCLVFQQIQQCKIFDFKINSNLCFPKVKQFVLLNIFSDLHSSHSMGKNSVDVVKNTTLHLISLQFLSLHSKYLSFLIFNFLLSYSWFTIIFKFQVCNIVIHSF